MLDPRFLVLPLSLLLFGFFDPYHFKDAESGLAVDPPNNFVVVQTPRRAGSQMSLMLGIFRYDADLSNPTPPFCVLGLNVRTDTAERTQQELNAQMRNPQYIVDLIEIYNGTYTVIADEPVELGDIPGHQVTMEEQGATGTYEDLLQVNTIFDTPGRRIILNCASTRTDLGSNMVSFELIRQSITLP